MRSIVIVFGVPCRNHVANMAPAKSLRESLAFARLCEPSGVEWETAPQSAFCRMVYGMADRPRALRSLGNGVVPLVAAHAWRTRSSVHGHVRVDPGTTKGGDRNETRGFVLK